MVKVRSGGGITSNKYVTSKSMKAEPVSQKGNPAEVAQQGMATAFRKEPVIAGQGYMPEKMGKVDRPSYRGPTEAGPGSNRVIYPAGTQSKTPAAR
jgi:hypothetical protein